MRGLRLSGLRRFFKKHAKILAFLLGCALMAVVVDSMKFRNKGYDMRTSLMKSSLGMMRTTIGEFKEREGRYPYSVEEVMAYLRGRPRHAVAGVFVDFEGRVKRGDVNETATIDNTGGYYYDKESGEIKVNLTKPVKDYIPFYFGRYRDEVPSEW